MKNTNKKGFTIVELVIVIAVIAILAAVLIPTFASIVKKANLSNDKSFVRNANITLQAEGAVDKFATAGDAIDALNRNGFTGKFNTYSSNFHYCYSLENNTMYLLDDKNAVIYPEENVDKATLWGLYMDNRTSVTAGVTKYVAMTNITNSQHYNDVFAEGTYTIDLNGYMIAVETTLTTVTANNGIVIKGATAGDGVNEDIDLVTECGGDNATRNTYYKGLGTTGADGTITISKKIITERVHIYPTENIVFENCVFYNQGVNIDDISGYDGYNVEFNNCQFIGILTNWAILAHGSVEVNNCTFTGLVDRGAIQVQENSNEINVKISESTFDGVSDNYPIIRFVGRDERVDASRTTGISSVEISGCAFTALNKADGILGFSGTGSSLYNYTGADGQPSVKFENNTFAESINGQYLVPNGKKNGAGEGNTLGSLLANSAK